MILDPRFEPTEYDYSHQCRGCGHLYTPKGSENEDCPRCGNDGKCDCKGVSHKNSCPQWKMPV